MPSHFSLNLKTLCAKPTGLVLSIGIVAFDENKIIKGEEIGLMVGGQAERGRTIDTDRLHWWLAEMRNQCTTYPYPFPALRYEPRDALLRLNAFILDNGAIPDKPSVPVNFVWCRGVNFDWTILENLSHQFSVGLPFQSNAIKDQRQFCDDHVKHMPDTRRNAEYDAIYHALNIQSTVRITDKKLD